MTRGQVSDSQHHGDEEKEMGINWEYSECHVKIRRRGGEKVRTKDESKGDGAARTQQRRLEGLGFGKGGGCMFFSLSDSWKSASTEAPSPGEAGRGLNA